MALYNVKAQKVEMMIFQASEEPSSDMIIVREVHDRGDDGDQLQVELEKA